MFRQNRQFYSQSRNQSRKTHWIVSKETFVLRAKASSIVLLAVLFSAAIAGADFYSKDQYIFQTDYNDDYEYQWSSSAGAYLENNEDTFSWTAPDVNMPEDVEISVLVTDRRCGCRSEFEKTIKVLPSEESPTEDVIYTNSTNLNQSDNDTEILSLLGDDHENFTEVLALENTKNDTDIDSIPEMQENASEMNSIENISKSMPEISTLSFDDGTKVDVVFAEDSSGDDLAYAVPQVDKDGTNEILSRDDELNPNQTELIDMTQELLAEGNATLFDPTNMTQPDISGIIMRMPQCYSNETEWKAKSEASSEGLSVGSLDGTSDEVVQPVDTVKSDSSSAGEDAAASRSEIISTIQEPQSISVPAPIDDQSVNAGCDISQSISK